MPVLLSAYKFQQSDLTWGALSNERYSIDHKSRRVLVRLVPGEALRVAYIMNCSGHEIEHSDSRFYIASLV
jgi:hypothetical protein